MSLTLYFHPFASFCQKVLIALYENDTPFAPHLVDLGDEVSRAAFLKVWPVGKFPVLRDEVQGRTIPESSIIIEHLALHYPGPTPLLPADPERALQARLWDRFYDLEVSVPMQKIVTDRLRPPGQRDRFGVEQAKAQLRTACDILEREMATKTWATGDAFTMADCAAAPALFYANEAMRLRPAHTTTAAYLDRLMQRPSFARVLKEAEPYRALFPREG
jgi:glutathione S-transferase